ncbi:MAG: helix-turn-helix transcriptional regulator [Eubacteriales bacterium]|nr:helix-turn-helix transcriptional regulator [Eubacteriales bacterium]
MSQNNPTMGERIRDCRKACGMTQSELAELVGVSTSAIVRYEKSPDDPDYTEPKVKTFKAIASALHVSEDYLLCKTNDPQAISVMSFLLPDDLSELIKLKLYNLVNAEAKPKELLSGFRTNKESVLSLVKSNYTVNQVKTLLQIFNLTLSSLFSPTETLIDPNHESTSPVDIPPDDEILEFILTLEDSERRQLDKYGVNSTEIDFKKFEKFLQSVIETYELSILTPREPKDWNRHRAELMAKCIQHQDYLFFLYLYDTMDRSHKKLATDILITERDFYLSQKEKEAERKEFEKKKAEKSADNQSDK